MDIEIEKKTNRDSNSISNPLDPEKVSDDVDNDNRVSCVSCIDIPEIDTSPVSKSFSHTKLIFAKSLFIVISIVVGVIVVVLTSAKQRKGCQMTLKSIAATVVDYDSRPRSLAFGNFNQDNQWDIVVANSGTDDIDIIFINYDGAFVNQTTYSTGSGSSPYSVVVSDFNKDKILDIAVANYGTHTIGIFLGKENGIFENQTTFSTGASRPVFLTVGDINNDNTQDLAVVNSGTNDMHILLGYGNGTFRKVATYLAGHDSLPCALALDNFNDDKRLDIAVANYGTNDIAVYLGYGNGSFTHPILYTTTPGSNPSSITVGDFNNDHQLDIVVANSGMNSIGIFFGYGNGSFATQILYSLGIISRPQFVTVGDLNQDNLTDIIILDAINSYGHVLPGYGNGTFSNLTTYIADFDANPLAAVVADFNNDNQPDIAVVNYGTNDVSILTGYSRLYAATKTQYSVGRNSHPPSVALADFNGDQVLDIVVAQYIADSIGVLIGYGNGSFHTVVSYALGTGSAPQCVCTGDFNNDNRTDIVTANYGSDTVAILFGHGNGHFSPVTTYSTGYQAYPIFVAVGDFNNDHALDIVAVNFHNDNVVVFLGYGNRSFAQAVIYSTGSGSDPSAIIVADFNNDTQLDLAVANTENSNVGILFGNGNGTFKTIITFSTGFESHPDSIVAGDLNNDHVFDIVVADSTSDYVAVLLGYQNGTFGQAVKLTDNSFSNPSGLALGDVDYDNILDIILTNFGTDNVGILSGYGNGSFYLSRSYPLASGSDPKGVTLGDVNNDTRWDIVITETGIGTINILVRYVAAEFISAVVYLVGSASHPYAVAVGDFNNDSHPDITVANAGIDNVGVFLGYGNGSFTPQKTYFVGSHSHPQYVTVGDFNQDNLIDIVTANSNDDSIGILFGDGKGSFADAILYSTKDGSEPYWVAISDFNNDNRLDFVVANQGRDSIGILLGYHYNTFKNQQTYSNQYSLRPSSIISYDLNNDTYPDIAATFAANDSVGILFGYGNGTFAQLIMYSVGYNSYPYEIVGVDVNNDNILDIIVANAGSNTLGVLLGYGNKTFAPVMTFSTGNNSSPYGAAPGDFNNDTYMDIVVANYHSNSIGVFLGYGNGTFATVVIYSTVDGSRPQSVAVGDFNQDGITDIVVANYRIDNVGLFLGNGDGTFQNQTTLSTGYLSMPTFIVVNDFDNDNQTDIAVTNMNIDNVAIFYGSGNGTFTSIVLYSTGSGTSPTCLRFGDFNNDALLDLAVASLGTNNIMVLYGLGDRHFALGPSFSTGTKSGPRSLAVGDFNKDGKLDITTANFLMNAVGIHISYGTQDFGGVITYSTGFDSTPYSVAVSDFNNDNQSDVVVANYGTNTVGILLGYGNGTFSRVVTYSMGDNSRPTVVIVGDLNLDNRTDVLVVNTEANNVNILLGYGNGSFFVVSIYSTGFRSNPSGLTVTDFNNDHIPDIIIVTAGTNSVLLAQGYGNGTFGNQTSYALGYNFDPYAVAVADFNGDSLIDIAIANYGGDYVEILLNTC